MIFIQVGYFILAAAVMAGVGVWFMIPPLRAQEFEQLFTRMMIAFALKLIIGVALMALAWKGFHWPSTMTAFGMVSAYVAALIILTVTAMLTVKRGQG